MNELDKQRPGTSQMSERFGPNFAPGSCACQRSIRLAYMVQLYAEAKTVPPGQRGTTRMHTKTGHTDARQRRHNTTASPRLLRGAGRCCCRPAATAAAAAVAAAAVLMLLCCRAAAVLLRLLHDPRCIAEHNTLQQTVSRFEFSDRTQERVTAQQ